MNRKNGLGWKPVKGLDRILLDAQHATDQLITRHGSDPASMALLQRVARCIHEIKREER